MTLDAEFSSTVRSAMPGWAAIGGTDSPSKRSSPYGSSSSNGTPVRTSTSAIAARRSADIVRPVGFWNVGMR